MANPKHNTRMRSLCVQLLSFPGGASFGGSNGVGLHLVGATVWGSFGGSNSVGLQLVGATVWGSLPSCALIFLLTQGACSISVWRPPQCKQSRVLNAHVSVFAV